MSREMTRLAIIEAAVRLFAHHGFERTTVDEVAAEAGVAKGTVFYNYKSKDDIFFALLEKGVADLTGFVCQRAEAQVTPQGKLEAIFDASVEFFHRYGSLCNVLISELGRIRSRWKKDPVVLLAPYQEVVARILVDGQRSGVFRQDLDPYQVGLMVFLLVTGVGLGNILTAERHDLQLAAPARQIFLQGVVSQT